MQEKAKRVKHAETFSCASRLNEQECVTVAVLYENVLNSDKHTSGFYNNYADIGFYPPQELQTCSYKN